MISSKKIWIAAGLLLSVLLVFSKFKNQEEPSRGYEEFKARTKDSSKSNSAITPPEIKAIAEKVIQSEKQVLDAVITEARVLYVGVRNDGTRRDGYASYLCQTMSDYPGASWERVKVVQVNTSNHPDRDNAYGVLLGEAWCK